MLYFSTNYLERLESCTRIDIFDILASNAPNEYDACTSYLGEVSGLVSNVYDVSCYCQSETSAIMNLVVEDNA